MKADIVFVLDASISARNNSLLRQKNFVKEFVSKFRVDTLNKRYQFAVLTYSYKVVVHINLNTYENNTALAAAIDVIEHDDEGPTFTDEALQAVKEDVLSSSRNGGIFMFSF